MRLLFTLLWPAAFLGCLKPVFDLACMSSGDCPPGGECSDGVCGPERDVPTDAGRADASAPREDAGDDLEDGGSSPDAGEPIDDAGVGPDAGPPADAGSTSVCGDGVRDDDEQCDDHNLAERDGCSSACRQWWDESYPVRLRVRLRSPVSTSIDAPLGLAVPAADFPATSPKDRLCLVADDHATVLPVEVERPATATLDALLWTRFTLESGDTDVYAYFGDDAACTGGDGDVWAGTTGAWHFEGRSDSAGSATLADEGAGGAAANNGARGAAFDVSAAGWLKVAPPGALWITGDVTLEVWGRLSNYGTAISWENTLFQAAGGGAAQAYFLNIENDGRLRAYWESSSTDKLSSASATINLGEWHHYAMVRDNTARRITFYVDGVRLGSTISFTGPPTESARLGSFVYFGGNFTDVARRFNGTLDEPRITGAALSADALAVSHASTGGALVLQTQREPAL